MMIHTRSTAPRPHRSRPGTCAVLSTLVGMLLAGASATAQAQPLAMLTAPTQHPAPAFDEQEIGHWRATYLRVLRLADEGDAEAARLALRMRHVTPKLLGGSVQVSGLQLRRWTGLVAQDDSANCDAPSAETSLLLQQ